MRGMCGADAGTGYIPEGISKNEELAVGLGISAMIVGGNGAVVWFWSACRQAQCESK
ncbi:hypothetical protein T484DRAFT_1775728 [Baffinella frigidus]|nr:hypothetical protein T484DRAFT_1775728 [Cryptophyta sp. CCMP2293]